MHGVPLHPHSCALFLLTLCRPNQKRAKCAKLLHSKKRRREAKEAGRTTKNFPFSLLTFGVRGEAALGFSPFLPPHPASAPALCVSLYQHWGKFNFTCPYARGGRGVTIRGLPMGAWHLSYSRKLLALQSSTLQQVEFIKNAFENEAKNGQK